MQLESAQEPKDYVATKKGTMELTQEDLNFYLQNKVELRQSTISKTVEEVKKIIHELTSVISLKDIRFQPISKSDLYNENIKVLAPNQFLITVPLKGLVGYKKQQNRRWRYYSLSGSPQVSPVRDPEDLYQWLEVNQFLKSLQQWHEMDVIMEGDIIPAKVLQVFRNLVDISIKTCSCSRKANLLESYGSTVRLEIETSVCQVEVELVPVVEIFNQWCDKARWPRCLKRWPSREKAECVKSIGFSLMACSRFHWQLNFSQAEYMLMEGIDEDGGCRKICFQVLRQMKEDVWCPGNRPIITSQHLKMVLFWTCEKYPHAKDWKIFTVSFLRLVRKLHKCVSQHFLKHYFVDGNNMFQYVSINDLDAIAQKLTLFLENPVLCWT
ncbi:protein mab-21-like 3 [Monodelphis domestica]|uniref:protein mab-21-like 3 n=1 Tax=Monodelphis domestica TaxID=13616 RepID=UPI00044310AD|nr:protein mab-21-like 3 [Monodelphis domestica]